MKATVTVMLKKGVLDPQGKAIGTALHGLGFAGVGTVRQGKVIEIEIPEGQDRDATRKTLAEMCEKLLVNPVIEEYRIALGETS